MSDLVVTLKKIRKDYIKSMATTSSTAQQWFINFNGLVYLVSLSLWGIVLAICAVVCTIPLSNNRYLWAYWPWWAIAKVCATLRVLMRFFPRALQTPFVTHTVDRGTF
jgi:hypothetical protein